MNEILLENKQVLLKQTPRLRLGTGLENCYNAIELVLSSTTSTLVTLESTILENKEDGERDNNYETKSRPLRNNNESNGNECHWESIIRKSYQTVVNHCFIDFSTLCRYHNDLDNPSFNMSLHSTSFSYSIVEELQQYVLHHILKEALPSLQSNMCRQLLFDLLPQCCSSIFGSSSEQNNNDFNSNCGGCGREMIRMVREALLELVEFDTECLIPVLGVLSQIPTLPTITRSTKRKNIVLLEEERGSEGWSEPLEDVNVVVRLGLESLRTVSSLDLPTVVRTILYHFPSIWKNYSSSPLSVSVPTKTVDVFVPRLVKHALSKIRMEMIYLERQEDKEEVKNGNNNTEGGISVWLLIWKEALQNFILSSLNEDGYDAENSAAYPDEVLDSGGGYYLQMLEEILSDENSNFSGLCYIVSMLDVTILCTLFGHSIIHRKKVEQLLCRHYFSSSSLNHHDEKDTTNITAAFFHQIGRLIYYDDMILSKEIMVEFGFFSLFHVPFHGMILLKSLFFTSHNHDNSKHNYCNKEKEEHQSQQQQLIISTLISMTCHSFLSLDIQRLEQVAYSASELLLAIFECCCDSSSLGLQVEKHPMALMLCNSGRLSDLVMDHFIATYCNNNSNFINSKCNNNARGENQDNSYTYQRCHHVLLHRYSRILSKLSSFGDGGDSNSNGMINHNSNNGGTINVIILLQKLLFQQRPNNSVINSSNNNHNNGVINPKTAGIILATHLYHFLSSCQQKSYLDDNGSIDSSTRTSNPTSLQQQQQRLELDKSSILDWTKRVIIASSCTTTHNAYNKVSAFPTNTPPSPATSLSIDGLLFFWFIVNDNNRTNNITDCSSSASHQQQQKLQHLATKDKEVEQHIFHTVRKMLVQTGVIQLSQKQQQKSKPSNENKEKRQYVFHLVDYYYQVCSTHNNCYHQSSSFLDGTLSKISTRASVHNNNSAIPPNENNTVTIISHIRYIYRLLDVYLSLGRQIKNNNNVSLKESKTILTTSLSSDKNSNIKTDNSKHDIATTFEDTPSSSTNNCCGSGWDSFPWLNAELQLLKGKHDDLFDWNDCFVAGMGLVTLGAIINHAFDDVATPVATIGTVSAYNTFANAKIENHSSLVTRRSAITMNMIKQNLYQVYKLMEQMEYFSSTILLLKSSSAPVFHQKGSSVPKRNNKKQTNNDNKFRGQNWNKSKKDGNNNNNNNTIIVRQKEQSNTNDSYPTNKNNKEKRKKQVFLGRRRKRKKLNVAAFSLQNDNNCIDRHNDIDDGQSSIVSKDDNDKESKSDDDKVTQQQEKQQEQQKNEKYQRLQEKERLSSLGTQTKAIQSSIQDLISEIKQSLFSIKLLETIVLCPRSTSALIVFFSSGVDNESNNNEWNNNTGKEGRVNFVATTDMFDDVDTDARTKIELELHIYEHLFFLWQEQINKKDYNLDRSFQIPKKYADNTTSKISRQKSTSGKKSHHSYYQTHKDTKQQQQQCLDMSSSSLPSPCNHTITSADDIADVVRKQYHLPTTNAGPCPEHDIQFQSVCDLKRNSALSSIGTTVKAVKIRHERNSIKNTSNSKNNHEKMFDQCSMIGKMIIMTKYVIPWLNKMRVFQIDEKDCDDDEDDFSSLFDIVTRYLSIQYRLIEMALAHAILEVGWKDLKMNERRLSRTRRQSALSSTNIENYHNTTDANNIDKGGNDCGNKKIDDIDTEADSLPPCQMSRILNYCLKGFSFIPTTVSNGNILSQTIMNKSDKAEPSDNNKRPPDSLRPLKDQLDILHKFFSLQLEKCDNALLAARISDVLCLLASESQSMMISNNSSHHVSTSTPLNNDDHHMEGWDILHTLYPINPDCCHITDKKNDNINNNAKRCFAILEPPRIFAIITHHYLKNHGGKNTPVSSALDGLIRYASLGSNRNIARQRCSVLRHALLTFWSMMDQTDCVKNFQYLFSVLNSAIETFSKPGEDVIAAEQPSRNHPSSYEKKLPKRQRSRDNKGGSAQKLSKFMSRCNSSHVPGLSERSFHIFFELLVRMILSSLSISSPYQVQTQQDTLLSKYNLRATKDDNENCKKKPEHIAKSPYQTIEQLVSLLCDMINFFVRHCKIFPASSLSFLLKSCFLTARVIEWQLEKCVQWRNIQPVISDDSDHLNPNFDLGSVCYLQQLIDSFASCSGVIVALCDLIRRQAVQKHQIQVIKNRKRNSSSVENNHTGRDDATVSWDDNEKNDGINGEVWMYASAHKQVQKIVLYCTKLAEYFRVVCTSHNLVPPKFAQNSATGGTILIGGKSDSSEKREHDWSVWNVVQMKEELLLSRTTLESVQSKHGSGGIPSKYREEFDKNNQPQQFTNESDAKSIIVDESSVNKEFKHDSKSPNGTLSKYDKNFFDGNSLVIDSDCSNSSSSFLSEDEFGITGDWGCSDSDEC